MQRLGYYSWVYNLEPTQITFMDPKKECLERSSRPKNENLELKTSNLNRGILVIMFAEQERYLRKNVIKGYETAHGNKIEASLAI